MAHLTFMDGQPEALIDLGAIKDNVSALARHVGGAQVLAVVKADGYGHGMVPAATAALAGGATWLGVMHVAEALTLRQAGLTARVLCLLGAPGAPHEEAIRSDVDLSAGSVPVVSQIAAAAGRAGRPARLHLKVDTGMSRGGATAADWPGLVAAALGAEATGHARIVGIWSHLACADIPGHPSINAQLDAFRAAVELAEKAGARPEVRHLANTPATLTLPEAWFDLVRPGGGIFGLSTVPGGAPGWLRPAMTVRAVLVQVKRVPAGTGVSYGHRYITSRDTTLGLVPLGYAEGVPRHATNTAEVHVRGRRWTISGTVCMNQVVVDFGDQLVAPGDEVVLFGPGDQGEPTAQEWADALGTLSYDIVTRFAGRVPRSYLGVTQVTDPVLTASSVDPAAPGAAPFPGPGVAGAAGPVVAARAVRRLLGELMANWRRITGMAGLVGAVVAAGAGAIVAAERIAIGRARLQPDPEADEPLGQLRGQALTVLAEDGVPLHAEIDGPDDAPVTIIFCHGYALSQDVWHYQRRDLAPAGRLVFWDQRGHGRSGQSGPDHSQITQLGVDLYAVLMATTPGPTPVVLVGHSMGGMTIMALARLHPELFGTKVIGAVLISTAACDIDPTAWVPAPLRPIVRHAAPPVLRGASKAGQAALVERGRQAAGDLAFLGTRHLAFGDTAVSPSVVDFLERIIRATPVGVVSDFFVALLDHDERAALGVLGRVPVTVVTGDRDRLVPPDRSDELAAEIRGSELVRVPGAGHVVQLEQPEVVNDAISGLLARSIARGQPGRSALPQASAKHVSEPEGEAGIGEVGGAP